LDVELDGLVELVGGQVELGGFANVALLDQLLDLLLRTPPRGALELGSVFLGGGLAFLGVLAAPRPDTGQDQNQAHGGNHPVHDLRGQVVGELVAGKAQGQ
jgi:hypothetical protein